MKQYLTELMRINIVLGTYEASRVKWTGYIDIRKNALPLWKVTADEIIRRKRLKYLVTTKFDLALIDVPTWFKEEPRGRWTSYTENDYNEEYLCRHFFEKKSSAESFKTAFSGVIWLD